ncbi:MAG: hypothetical protein WDW38_002781 [Sanguina aurantia]
MLLAALPNLLTAYWLLATGAVLVVLLPLPIPDAFRAAVRLSAMRGKLWGNQTAAKGFLQNASVPQRWFAHFYLLGSVVNAGCVALAVAVARLPQTTPQPGDTSNLIQAHTWVLLFAFQLHLFRRYVETIGIMHYPAAARMHVVAYVFALTYYAAAPLSMLPSSAFKLELLQGLLVFLSGNALQLQSHVLLARLATRSKTASKDTKRAAPSSSAKSQHDQEPQRQYSIPHGGLFSLVSCPHYLAEIVIYLGLWLISGLQLNQALMLAWVVSNLVLAAGETQAWYLRRFPDYPETRTALLPWLY